MITGLGNFINAQPFAWNGPVGCYLAGRGIEPERFARRPLNALRFEPRCWHHDVGEKLPAMLAAIIDPVTRQHVALHRTYLHDGAGGVWRKSRVVPAKKVLGKFAGGIIPLTRGASGKPIRHAPDGDRCIVAEGIENALTVAQWFPEWRAIAAVAVANLPLITLPPAMADIMLVRDRDGENQAVQEARARAIVRWIDEGRRVEEWIPPDGCKDANEYWQQVKNGEREA